MTKLNRKTLYLGTWIQEVGLPGGSHLPKRGRKLIFRFASSAYPTFRIA
jgi:hypothetical protein